MTPPELRGPSGGWYLGPLMRMRRAPLAFFTQVRNEYGPRAHWRLGARHVFTFHDPDGAREVLVTRERHFMKGMVLRRARAILGDGLLTSEGDFHLRQRRLSQPAFHRQRIEAYGAVMAEEAERTAESWREGSDFDVAEEMMRLALAIVGRTLFGVDVTASSSVVGRALSDALSLFDKLTLPFAELLQWTPLPSARKFRTARRALYETIDRVIAERRAQPLDRGDLLSMLLLARDEDGSAMSDLQLREEALTIFLAGHETTANALTWTLHLLAKNPDAEARLHAEVDAVCGDRPVLVSDYPKLAWTQQCFAEAIRLYPPAWILGRRAVEEVEICGVRVPAGSVVLVSPYVVQRDPAYWPDPERFDPTRFSPEAKAARPRFAFFAFGAGSRQCIGESFAWMEGTLALAAIARRWRLRHAPNAQVDTLPLITLRPRYGMRMIAERRGATSPAMNLAERTRPD